MSDSLIPQSVINLDNIFGALIRHVSNFLVRAANANVQPLTIAVTQYVGNHFELGHSARKDITKAVESLSCVDPWSKVVQFGFGIRSLPRLMNDTDQGLLCLALAAALVDCYSVSFSGEVLFSIVQLLQLSPEQVPSMHEWTNFSSACAGSLSKSPIPEAVAKMIDLCIRSLSEQDICLRKPRAEELAETVLALGNISRGILTNVVVEGGLCVGFLAAIAVWLLNMKVELHAVDGTIIYSTCPDQEEPDAKFMLAPLKGRRGDETTLQTVSKTYEISDGKRLFAHGGQKSFIITDVSFRMPWDKCLSYAFGMEPGFEPLMRDLKLVGTAIGSAANLFDKLSIDAASTVFGKQGYELQGGMAYYRYLENPRLRGQELLQRSFKQLPELDSSVTRTAANQALHANNALQSLLHCFHSMWRLCHCTRPLPPQGLCECGADWAEFLEVLDSKAGLLKFIIKLCWLLAHADIEEGVSPSFSGFQRLYSPVRANSDEDLMESILAVGQGPTDEFSSNIVSLLASLFVNHHVPSKPSEWRLACSEAGVCVYHSSMLTLDTRSDSFMSYHILPGGIEMHGKTYSQVLSQNLADRNCEDISAYDNCRLLATVSHATLYVSWALQQTSANLRNPGISFSISSNSIQKRAADALYLFRERGVSHKRCQCPIESLIDSSWQYDKDGNLHNSIDHRSIVIYATNPSNILFRQLALMESTGQECFVQGRFCLGRCLEVLKRYSTQQRAEAEDEWRETDEAHKKLLKDLKKNEKNLVEEEKRLVDRRGQHEVDAPGLEREIHRLQDSLKNLQKRILQSELSLEDHVKFKQGILEGDRYPGLKDMYIFPV